MLIAMIQMGICMGIQPLLAYNYGAKDILRMKEVIRKVSGDAFRATVMSLLRQGALLIPLLYLLHALMGMSAYNMTGQTLYALMTNDPKQRSMVLLQRRKNSE